MRLSCGEPRVLRGAICLRDPGTYRRRAERMATRLPTGILAKPESVDESDESSRLIAPTWIVNKESREGRTPISKY